MEVSDYSKIIHASCLILCLRCIMQVISTCVCAFIDTLTIQRLWIWNRIIIMCSWQISSAESSILIQGLSGIVVYMLKIGQKNVQLVQLWTVLHHSPFIGTQTWSKSRIELHKKKDNVTLFKRNRPQRRNVWNIIWVRYFTYFVGHHRPETKEHWKILQQN
jgi:hypothetical protein